jgi:hypothetical protein
MDIKLRDRTSRATNSIYDQMHRSATDMTSDLVQRKTLVALLTASLVAPEDRFTYFRGMIEMLYAKVGRKQTHFFKVRYGRWPGPPAFLLARGKRWLNS